MNIGTVVEIRDALTIIHLKGDLYPHNIGLFQEIWSAQIRKSPRVVGIDCHDLNSVDSSAAHYMGNFAREACNREIKLVFYDMKPSILKTVNRVKQKDPLYIITKSRFEDEYVRKKAMV